MLLTDSRPSDVKAIRDIRTVPFRDAAAGVFSVEFSILAGLLLFQLLLIWA